MDYVPFPSLHHGNSHTAVIIDATALTIKARYLDRGRDGGFCFVDHVKTAARSQSFLHRQARVCITVCIDAEMLADAPSFWKGTNEAVNVSLIYLSGSFSTKAKDFLDTYLAQCKHVFVCAALTQEMSEILERTMQQSTDDDKFVYVNSDTRSGEVKRTKTRKVRKLTEVETPQDLWGLFEWEEAWTDQNKIDCEDRDLDWDDNFD